MPIIIPEGMRAVSVRVDDIGQVAGFAIQGTRVDLMLTQAPPGGGEQITKIVMQNLPLIAAGQTVQPDPNGNPVLVGLITVLVTPEDGEKLAHIMKMGGQMQFALRNMLDVKEVRTNGVRMAQIMTGARAPAGGGGGAVRPRPVAPTTETPQSGMIEMYKAGVKSTIRFNRGGGDGGN
jgi:pilus assembly protein CpaB